MLLFSTSNFLEILSVSWKLVMIWVPIYWIPLPPTSVPTWVHVIPCEKILKLVINMSKILLLSLRNINTVAA